IWSTPNPSLIYRYFLVPLRKDSVQAQYRQLPNPTVHSLVHHCDHQFHRFLDPHLGRSSTHLPPHHLATGPDYPANSIRSQRILCVRTASVEHCLHHFRVCQSARIRSGTVRDAYVSKEKKRQTQEE